MFFALSNCWGGLIALASYNRFHHRFYGLESFLLLLLPLLFFRYNVEYCVHSNTKMLNLETKTKTRPRQDQDQDQDVRGPPSQIRARRKRMSESVITNPNPTPNPNPNPNLYPNPHSHQFRPCHFCDGGSSRWPAVIQHFRLCWSKTLGDFVVQIKPNFIFF